MGLHLIGKGSECRCPVYCIRKNNIVLTSLQFFQSVSFVELIWLPPSRTTIGDAHLSLP
jgi:hypothetical protein